MKRQAEGLYSMKVHKSRDEDWHAQKLMNKCKRGASDEYKTQVKFQIMKYLVFSQVLKEKCPPHNERWGGKNGQIEQY